MPQPLSILALPAQAGPGPLDLLAHLATAGHDEITMLHSAAGESNSVIGFDPLITLEIDGAGRVNLKCPFDLKIPGGLHPLATLEHVARAVSYAAPHPLIGWLGFISYDIGRTLEVIPRTARDELHWPLLQWTLFRNYLLHDPATGHWTPVSIEADPAPLGELPGSVQPAAVPSDASAAVLVRSVSPECFKANVERVREYIAAGDIYQANLARHWEIETADQPVDIYRRLCAASPAPYAGFLQFTSTDGVRRQVLSASPELFLSVADGRVVTRPIKGTRRRDANAARDALLRDELADSEKDRAELAMIVDLMRNDLGRVSRFGTVNVDAAREIEPHPTVWHTAATISSALQPRAGLADLLAAVCPGGSITGAPKIRAMQIIEELEGFRRGLYCGNIGVIGPQARTLTLNIAIRTIIMQAGRAHVYAGGGIVADSDPQLECEETQAKAAALLRALGTRE